MVCADARSYASSRASSDLICLGVGVMNTMTSRGLLVDVGRACLIRAAMEVADEDGSRTRSGPRAWAVRADVADCPSERRMLSSRGTRSGESRRGVEVLGGSEGGQGGLRAEKRVEDMRVGGGVGGRGRGKREEGPDLIWGREGCGRVRGLLLRMEGRDGSLGWLSAGDHRVVVAHTAFIE